MERNRKINLRSRPLGYVSRENFSIIEEPVGRPGSREILVRTSYVSVDPYMRHRMKNMKSYVEPFKTGQLISGDATGCVVESNSSRFREGDIVRGSWGWQEYGVVKEKDAEIINLDIAPETAYLGVLGLTGLTAFFGLLEIGQPVSGETVVISGAAGSTGSIAGQIARIMGCRVVGITGSDEKASFLIDQLGFHEAINYKNFPNVRKPLMKICQDGVDVYFDNVGGEISDSVFYLINNHARIVLCGQISQYNLERMSTGPRLNSLLLIHRARMQGFIVSDYKVKFPGAESQLAKWLTSGKIRYQVQITDGIENVPDAFMGLFRGENTGKQLVKM